MRVKIRKTFMERTTKAIRHPGEYQDYPDDYAMALERNGIVEHEALVPKKPKKEKEEREE